MFAAGFPLTIIKSACLPGVIEPLCPPSLHLPIAVRTPVFRSMR
jgi:hypothetical protein